MGYSTSGLNMEICMVHTVMEVPRFRRPMRSKWSNELVTNFTQPTRFTRFAPWRRSHISSCGSTWVPSSCGDCGTLLHRLESEHEPEIEPSRYTRRRACVVFSYLASFTRRE